MISISIPKTYRDHCTTAAGKRLSHFLYICNSENIIENLIKVNRFFCLLEEIQTLTMIHNYLAVAVVAVFAMYRCCISWQRNSKREEEKELLAEISNRRTERVEIQLNVQRERSEQVRAIASAIQSTIQGICDTVSTILSGREQTTRQLAQLNLRRVQDTNTHNAGWWANLGASVLFVAENGPKMVNLWNGMSTE